MGTWLVSRVAGLNRRSMDAFAELCATYGTTDVGKEVLEQILAVDDFLSFKTMMVKRNMELELESLRALQELTDNGIWVRPLRSLLEIALRLLGVQGNRGNNNQVHVDHGHRFRQGVGWRQTKSSFG